MQMINWVGGQKMDIQNGEEDKEGRNQSQIPILFISLILFELKQSTFQHQRVQLSSRQSVQLNTNHRTV